MAITTLGLTGFEHGFIGSGAQNGGGLFDAAPGSGWSASTSSPRNGSRCARLVAPATTATTLVNNIASNPTKVVLRFGFRLASGHTGGVEVFSLQNSTPAKIVTLTASTGGILSVSFFGGSLVSSPALTKDVWHLIEMQIDTVAKTLDWKVDGVAQTQATSPGAPNNVAKITLGTTATSGPTFTADYDDVIIGTWTVAGTDWYGDGKVLGQVAGVDGVHNTPASLSPGDAGTAYPAGGMTNANTMVDDPPGTGGWTATRSTTDNIALRVATAGAYVSIGPASTAEAGQANAVKAIMSYSSPTTTANLAACAARNNAAAVSELWGLPGGVGKDYSETANQFKSAIVTQPAAGWTAFEVNAVRWRFGGCTSVDINPVPTVQAMMLEVDWPILPTATPVAGISLAAGSEPETRTLHKIKLRARKASGTGTVELNAALYEGATNRSGDLTTALTTSLADYTLAIPDASAANITDYSDLELRVWADSPTGDAVAVEVTKLLLETPLALVGGTPWSETPADALGVTDSVSFVFGYGVPLADPLALTDARAFDQTELIADPIAITDARVFDQTESLADALGVTDSVAAGLSFVRQQDDALGLTDVQVLLATYARTLADPLAVTDAQALDRTASIADALGLTDVQTFVATYERVLADALGITDSVNAAILKLVQQDDALGITDSLAFLAVLQRSISDALGLTDATSVDRGLALADALGLTDAQAFAAAFSRGVADPLGLTDSINAAIVALVAQGDVLGLTDLFNATAVLERLVADPLGVADAQLFISAYLRQQNDPLGLMDLAAMLQDFVLTRDDPLGLVDQAAPLAVTQRTLADALALSDLANTSGAGGLNISDVLGLTDARLLAIGFVQADLLALTDAPALDRGLIVNDPLAITDARLLELVRQQLIVDVLAVTDARQTVAVLARTFADELGVTDLQASQLALMRALADALALSDYWFLTGTGIEPPPDTHPNLGGVFDQASTNGVIRIANRDGIVLLDARTTGGLVVVRKRGGSVRMRVRSGLPNQGSRSASYDTVTTGGTVLSDNNKRGGEVL